MPEIKPFRGIFYNLDKVNLSDVVAPPYDVISPEQQDRLYAASPYNVVRLILGREDERYSSAAKYYGEWRNESILIKDEMPSIYYLVQNFAATDGTSVERSGFIARCRLEEFGKGSILPHEKTLAKPKEDRFRLLQATHATFSQIFGLYADREYPLGSYFDTTVQDRPFREVTFEGVRNRVWRITDESTMEAIQRGLHNAAVLIADGHHRYETALNYRDYLQRNNPHHTGEEGYNYIMMYFTHLHDKGLVILPTHRIMHGVPDFNSITFLEKLRKYFYVESHSSSEKLLASLRKHTQFAVGVVIPTAPNYILCWLKDGSTVSSLLDASLPDVVKRLDVTILHSLILEKILGLSKEAQEQKRNLEYVKDAQEGITSVKSGKSQVAFLMNPTPVEDVRTVAEAGFTMPQKSTYFYPKLLSGLVINSLDED